MSALLSQPICFNPMYLSCSMVFFFFCQSSGGLGSLTAWVVLSYSGSSRARLGMRHHNHQGVQGPLQHLRTLSQNKK